MKILLTAPPGIGKSTVIATVVKEFPAAKRGIVARENLDESGRRTGFTAINQAGQSRQFMFLTDTPTAETIGGLFDVDVSAIDEFVVGELRAGLELNVGLLYVDEAGRAQAKSSRFLALLRQILASDSNILGSIVYEDEPWSLEFKRAPGVCILEVSLENREALPSILLAAYNHQHLFRQLTPVQQEQVLKSLSTLVNGGQFVSAQKLFTNTLGYVVEGKIKKSPDRPEWLSAGQSEFMVAGQTSDHRLKAVDSLDMYWCDCDLSNGKGPFAGKAAVCSHEMAIRLQRLTE